MQSIEDYPSRKIDKQNYPLEDSVVTFLSDQFSLTELKTIFHDIGVQTTTLPRLSSPDLIREVVRITNEGAFNTALLVAAFQRLHIISEYPDLSLQINNALSKMTDIKEIDKLMMNKTTDRDSLVKNICKILNKQKSLLESEIWKIKVSQWCDKYNLGVPDLFSDVEFSENSNIILYSSNALLLKIGAVIAPYINWLRYINN